VARSRRSWGAVRKLPSGRFQARYLDADSRQMLPAPQTFATKRAADVWLAKKRTELDAGTAINERTGNRPLSQWWPAYWRSVQSNKERTKVGYEAAWRLRVEPRFGSNPVRRIKPAHIDEWVADMVEDGVSASEGDRDPRRAEARPRPRRPGRSHRRQPVLASICPAAQAASD
jgi:hypothetical protein